MNTRILRVSAVVLLGIALVGCTEEDDFTPLFNGEDLTGWVPVNAAPDTWSVRDGMIVCSGVPTGVMRTTEHYENFILELEWRHVHEGGNAGLFVYSGALPVRGKPFTRSVECQIMDGNHGDVFAIQGATMVPDRPHPQGWMRCLPSEERAHPAGSWNHYRVESRDGRLSLAVNGEVVSGGSQSVPRRGYIVLESEGSEVHFRNIRIQTLPSSNPPPEETASLDEGFTSLYTGVDLAGWQANDDHLAHWNPNDWRLAYDGAGDLAPLWSDQVYENFELILDWRFTDSDATEEADAFLLLRGSDTHRIPLWNSPTGSGGLLMPDGGVFLGLVPSTRADRESGEWNRIELTLTGDRLTVVLNEQTVVDGATVDGLPEQGPIGLFGQEAAMEVANVYVKALP